LFSTAVTSEYFSNVSVMHRMYLCWHPVASIGINRSAWILTFGLLGFAKVVMEAVCLWIFLLLASKACLVV
jgi:hypothetical protein